MDILKERIVTARKDHYCELCERKINKGDKYLYQFVVDGGDKYNSHMHAHCYDLAIEMGYDWTYSDFVELVIEEGKLLSHGRYDSFKDCLKVCLQYYKI